MSLRIVFEVNHHNGEPGRYSPRVYCDHCGNVIKSAADGLYCWNPDDARREAAEVYFVHDRCKVAFFFEHGQSTYSSGLNNWLFFLINVLSADMTAAERRAKFFEGAGL